MYNYFNYHFTYEIENEFTYVQGTKENPRIFTSNVNLDELDLIDGETYTLKLFFAERHMVHSNFRIDTNIEFPELIVFAD